MTAARASSRVPAWPQPCSTVADLCMTVIRARGWEQNNHRYSRYSTMFIHHSVALCVPPFYRQTRSTGTNNAKDQSTCAPSFMPPRRRAVRGLCRSSADSARVTPLTASSALWQTQTKYAFYTPRVWKRGWLSFSLSALARRNTLTHTRARASRKRPSAHAPPPQLKL